MRALREADRAFVCASWIRDYERSALAAYLGRDGYRPTMARALNRLLARASVLASVACDVDDEELLFGFSCIEMARGQPTCLHYVYVRPEMRGQGIATRLLRGVDLDETSAPWGDLPWRPQRAW